MRIGLFFNGISAKEFCDIEAIFSGKKYELEREFEAVKIENFLHTDISKIFETLHLLSKEGKTDFSILFHHYFKEVFNPSFLKKILLNERVQNALISIGVGQIKGSGFIFSPKLPYIEEDCIILNMKECEKIGFSERVKYSNTYSHFEDAGGLHAVLISFLEAVIPYGGVYIYPSIVNVNKKIPLHQKFIDRVLEIPRKMLNLVNYEIQKKYEDKT